VAQDELEGLLAALKAEPANALLRLAIVRRMIAAGAKSRALELALDLAEDAVAEAGDRRLIAALFEEAGLQGRAAAWRETAPESQEAQGPPPSQEAPIRTLRVVGGRDASEDERVVELPDAPGRLITFAQVGGLAEVKKDIERRIIAPFTQKHLFAKFRKKSGGGVLLYGPPGCGKTLLARATAGECALPFQAVSIPEILDPYFGVSEQRLAALFDNARARAPAVVFFDEIDAFAAKRTAMMATHVAQLVSHFLNEMDGARGDNEGLLILAATNIPWSIDPAFLRPGRFDRLFFVPPPDRAAREAILDLELAERPRAHDVGLKAIAERTNGFSGADLAGIVERAADAAIDASMEKGEEIPIDQRMLLDAAGDVRSSVLDWLTTAKNYATYSNESGRYDDILAFLQKHGR
jgi:SpoVK/Ycf46/Vps4 family AAA+-type ATPase